MLLLSLLLLMSLLLDPISAARKLPLIEDRIHRKLDRVSSVNEMMYNVSVPNLPEEDKSLEANDGLEQMEVTICRHGSKVYEHGAQWTSVFDKCVMCNCDHGLVKCDPVVCPILNCSKTYKTSDYCCPTCYNSLIYTNTTVENSCTLGGQTFIAGSTWYPYIPPNGFDTCTVCICEVKTLKVKCQRVYCPPLSCRENMALRPDKKSCCKVCPNKTSSAQDVDLSSSSVAASLQFYDTAISDQQVVKEKNVESTDDECEYSFGGPYQNGNQWHPVIYSQGIITIRCVTCRCKAGKVQCERKKCTTNNVSCNDPCCASKHKCATRRKRHSPPHQTSIY